MQDNTDRERIAEPVAQSTGMRATVIAMLEIDDLVMSETLIEFDAPPPGWTTPMQLIDVFRVRAGRLCEHWDLAPSAELFTKTDRGATSEAGRFRPRPAARNCTAVRSA